MLRRTPLDQCVGPVWCKAAVEISVSDGLAQKREGVRSNPIQMPKRVVQIDPVLAFIEFITYQQEQYKK